MALFRGTLVRIVLELGVSKGWPSTQLNRQQSADTCQVGGSAPVDLFLWHQFRRRVKRMDKAVCFQIVKRTILREREVCRG